MITAEQLKDILDRTDALHRYLDIDRKKIEFEEEDLRTQAPDFWDAPNLLLTPHVSGNMSLAKTCQLVIDIFLRNLGHWNKGEPLEHVVDLRQGY